MAECVLVSFEPTNGVDTSVLIVGKKTPRADVEIVNAYQGEEAVRLWDKLINNYKPKGE